MTALMRRYIRAIDAMNYRIGRVMMYGIFAMMGILFWSTATKVGSDLGLGINPSLWTLETAQFAMVAYYILGGPYAIQMGSNVRMDLLYGEWSDRRKAQVDAITVLFLIAVFAPLIAPYDPAAQNIIARLKPPAWLDGGGLREHVGAGQG